MTFKKLELEDATQDFYLENLEAGIRNPEFDKKRIKNIMVANDLSGKRTGSSYSGTLKYHWTVSLDTGIADFGLSIPESESFQETVESSINVKQNVNLIKSRLENNVEKTLIDLYLKYEGSPGLMSEEFGTSPQYLNRKMNQLIQKLRKRLGFVLE